MKMKASQRQRLTLVISGRFSVMAMYHSNSKS
nr:MAG TPA: hypothetical protein [Caudoviricetes sp.]